MIDRDSPVTDDELHAYVDGVLPADRRQRGRSLACLASRRRRAGRRMARAGRRDPRPLRRGRRGAGAGALRPRQAGAPAAAVAARSRRRRCVAAVIGGVAGWFGARRRRDAAPAVPEIMTAEALSAHRLYIAEVRHPIEVRAAEQHLMPWLSKRVGTNLRAPDLKAVLAQTPRRPAAARPDRPGGAVHV